MTRLHLLLILCFVSMFAFACGDDGEAAEPENNAPAIDAGSLTFSCNPVDDSDFDGTALTRISVTITDKDNDLDRVTATVLGSVLVLEAKDANSYVYDYGDDSNSLLRCATGTPVLIRATDSLDLVSELEATLP